MARRSREESLTNLTLFPRWILWIASIKILKSYGMRKPLHGLNEPRAIGIVDASFGSPALAAPEKVQLPTP
jgi:hypothetical protein